MAGVSGGQDTVEHIYASCNGFQNIDRCSNPHEVAWLIRGHVWLYGVDDLIHRFCWLPYCQATDGIAVTVQLSDLLHVPYP